MRSIRMSRVFLSGALALGALGAAFGFTPGVTTAEAASSASPFAGSWFGTWSVAADGVVGTFDWAISDAGRLTGRTVNTTFGRSGAIVGHVSADGNVKLTRYVPNDDPSSGYSSYPFQGTAVIVGDELLVSVAPPYSDGPLIVAILERN
jgi:hypothetical protein